ncbi:MAG TPA: hypothetical protein VFP34_16965 [Microlunatus sp.]|nr:hypothetical protein [Microlunatus sp.]
MVAVLSRSSFPVLVLILISTLVGCGTTPPLPATSPAPPAPSGATSSASARSGPTPAPTTTPSAARAQLPRGGTKVFPRYRLVGYAGLTGAKTLGRLGTGPLDQRVAEIERRATPYAAGRQILPVVEVITTIVQGSPGRDGMYRVRLSDDKIETYLRVARKHKAVLLLNIQPGRADFLDEVKAYRRWLREPDVGVALDPEWAMDAHQVPGRVFGHTTGRELDTVAAYLSGIVAQNRLPEKIMVYHQLAPRIVRAESDLKPHPGVALVKSVDGIGSRAAKMATYRAVSKTTPRFVQPGFKLFFDEDKALGRLMTPAQVLALRPRPAYVLYE